jgi:hypothetical protein
LFDDKGNVFCVPSARDPGTKEQKVVWNDCQWIAWLKKYQEVHVGIPYYEKVGNPECATEKCRMRRW